MTSLSARTLFKAILFDTLGVKSTDVDTSDKALIELIKNTNLFEDVTEEKDKCFTAAIRFGNERIITLMFNDYEKKGIKIDFSQRAFTDIENMHNNINILQYVFKYSTPANLQKCLDMIKDNDTARALLNKPITSSAINDVTGQQTSNVSSVWEHALISILPQNLIVNPRKSLNRKKYNINTINFITIYFHNWSKHSMMKSDFVPDIHREWKKYAERNGLETVNPELTGPIELLIDPLERFRIAINNGLIEPKSTGAAPYNFIELLKILSLPPSDPMNNETWEKLIPRLSRKFTSKNFAKPLEYFTNTSSDLNAVNLELKKNFVDYVIKEGGMLLNVTYDFRNLSDALQKMVASLEQDDITKTFRRHSAERKEIESKVDNVATKINGLVEIRKNQYIEEKKDNKVAIDIFSRLSAPLLAHIAARDLAMTKLFTANSVTDSARYAKLFGAALKTTAHLIPIQGAEIIPNLYSVGERYITGNFVKEQNKGVFETSIQLNLPILLIELSEAITELLVQVENKHKISHQKNGLTNLIDEIAQQVNNRLDSLHKDIAKDGVPTEVKLRGELFKVASEVIAKNAFTKEAKPMTIRQINNGSRSGSGDSGNSSGSSEPKRKPGRCSLQ